MADFSCPACGSNLKSGRRYTAMTPWWKFIPLSKQTLDEQIYCKNCNALLLRTGWSLDLPLRLLAVITSIIASTIEIFYLKNTNSYVLGQYLLLCVSIAYLIAGVELLISKRPVFLHLEKSE